MSVGARETRHRSAREQERLQHAALDKHRALRGHSLVVVLVEAVQAHATEPRQRGIVQDGQEARQDGLADPSLERAPVLVVVLTLALEPMSDRLVEEHARRLGREQGGPRVRVQDRRAAQREQLRDHLVDLSRELFSARQFGLARAIEVPAVLQQHAVGRARPGLHVQAVDDALGDQARALGAGHLALLAVDAGTQLRIEQLGVRAQTVRLEPQLALPRLGVEGVLRPGHHVDVRFLAREAGRPLRIVGPVDLLALLLEVGRKRLLVEIVGEQPQRVAQRGRVVVEGRVTTRAVARVLAVEVEHLLRAGVVEFVAPHPHVDLQPALAPDVVEEDRAVLRADLARFAAAHRVREEVGSLVPADAQVLLRAGKLFDEGGQDPLARIVPIRRGGEQRAEQQGEGHGSVVPRVGARHKHDRAVGGGACSPERGRSSAEGAGPPRERASVRLHDERSVATDRELAGRRGAERSAGISCWRDHFVEGGRRRHHVGALARQRSERPRWNPRAVLEEFRDLGKPRRQLGHESRCGRQPRQHAAGDGRQLRRPEREAVRVDHERQAPGEDPSVAIRAYGGATKLSQGKKTRTFTSQKVSDVVTTSINPGDCTMYSPLSPGASVPR